MIEGKVGRQRGETEREREGRGTISAQDNLLEGQPKSIQEALLD